MQTVAAIEVAAPTITMTTSMPSGDAQRTMFEDRRVLNLAFYVMVVVAVVYFYIKHLIILKLNQIILNVKFLIR